MTTSDPIIGDILARGCDDWVHLAEMASVVRSSGRARSEDDVMALSLEAIRTLLEHELAAAGDLKQTEVGLEFVPWGLPVDDIVTRIEHGWRALGRLPWPGDVCWLCNTPEGDRMGKAHIDGIDGGDTV